MGFRTGSYAKIWDIKPNNKYTDVRLTVSRKNKETNEYEQDFGGWTRLIGKAHDEAKKLSIGDKIKIGECDCTNSWDRDKNVTYYSFKIFSLEKDEDGAKPKTKTDYPFADGGNNEGGEAKEDKDDLPF